MRSLVFFLCLVLNAQIAEKANEQYGTPENRKGVAASLSDSGRDERQKPIKLVATLEIKPGMTVVDFGSGTGYMLRYLSQAVGDKGHVIAEDIFPDFLDRAKKTAADAGLKNVQFVLGTERQSNLPTGAVDVILALDSYHHLNYPAEVLADLKSKLKQDGRLVVVEYHKNEVSMPNRRALEHIRLKEADAVREIEASGFRVLSHRDFIPQVQWIGIFQAK